MNSNVYLTSKIHANALKRPERKQTATKLHAGMVRDYFNNFFREFIAGLPAFSQKFRLKSEKPGQKNAKYPNLHHPATLLSRKIRGGFNSLKNRSIRLSATFYEWMDDFILMDDGVVYERNQVKMPDEARPVYRQNSESNSRFDTGELLRHVVVRFERLLLTVDRITRGNQPLNDPAMELEIVNAGAAAICPVMQIGIIPERTCIVMLAMAYARNLVAAAGNAMKWNNISVGCRPMTGFSKTVVISTVNLLWRKDGWGYS